MSNLREISDAIFKYRGNWEKITNEDKEKNFFIVNRFLSKTYPIHAMLMNSKSQDPVSGLNIWYYFMADKHFPKDFWSKSKKEKYVLIESDIKLLMVKLDIDKKENIDYLLCNYKDMLLEELKWLKSTQKK